MKSLTKIDLSSIWGGWADPEKCMKVQEMVPKKGEGNEEEWDKWLKDFDRYCLGI